MAGKVKQKKLLAAAVLLGLFCGISVTEAALPEYFDYRKEVHTKRDSKFSTKILPEVRNQAYFGTCWSFGALASYETAWNLKLQKQGLSTEGTDFSERYIAWLAYQAPLDGTWQDTKYYAVPRDFPELTIEQGVYHTGGWPVSAFLAMMRWGNALESTYPYSDTKFMDGVQSVVSAGGNVHDMYGFKGLVELGEGRTDYLKQLIKDFGTVPIGIYSVAETMSEDLTEYYNPSTEYQTNHTVAIVGWDDAYEFENFENPDGSLIKGAWIVRNSWGAYGETGGYFYVPYQDKIIRMDGVLNPEMDGSRYTRLDTNSYIFGPYANEFGNKVTYANRLTAQAHQMLKAVNFYVPHENSSYKIEVRTKADTPTGGKLVYTQAGKFGEDGTPIYGGYRTVDLKEYVFLPKHEQYMVVLTLQAPDGKKQILMMTGQHPDSLWQDVSSEPGLCYVYNEETGKWFDTYPMENGGKVTIPIYARSKDSALPNGADFTVAYLHDDGVGGSYINLGKATELYGSDTLNPDRKTLSNMTVNLTADVTDSIYGGVIYGEGGVRKTGTGKLTLLGQNIYTGTTNIEAGTLSLGYLADGSGGSLISPVQVAAAGTLAGNGLVHNTLTNSGKVSPGNSIGTLLVDDYVQNSSGVLQLEGGRNNNDRLLVKGKATIDGTVHIVPLGYFANGENTLRLSDFIQADNLQYMAGLKITSEDAKKGTVNVAATSNIAEKTVTFNASRTPNAYSSLAMTTDGLTLGKVLDKVAGAQSGDGQNLVAGIDFYGMDVNSLGTQMQPRAYDSLMRANLKNQQFVGKSLVNELLTDGEKTGEEGRIFAKALRYSSHQNSRNQYDAYGSMVSGVLVGYDKEAKGWRYGLHGAYLSGSGSVEGATPLHNDYSSGTLGIHGIRKMDKDFIYGYLQGIWERNDAYRQTMNSLYGRKNEAKWNGSGISIEVGGGHSFKSVKHNKSLTPYASLNYSKLRWDNVNESSSAGNSMAVSRSSSSYSSLLGTIGLKAQAGYNTKDGRQLSYDATLAYDHEFMRDMPGYNYRILDTEVHQSGYQKPSRDVIRVLLGLNVVDRKKFGLRTEVGKAWGRQGYSELQVGLKGEWNF